MALAVNERDASQSGGIQTTMRNVGQAIGVAAIGAVLLFGITANIDNAMADSPIITPRSAPPWPSATSRSWATSSSSRPSPTSP